MSCSHGIFAGAGEGQRVPFPQLWVHSHGFPLGLSLCFCTLISPHVKNKRLAVKLGRGMRERRFIGELIPVLDPEFLCGRRQGPQQDTGVLSSRVRRTSASSQPLQKDRRPLLFSRHQTCCRPSQLRPRPALDLKQSSLTTLRPARFPFFFFLRLVGEGWGFEVVDTGIAAGMCLLLNSDLLVSPG